MGWACHVSRSTGHKYYYNFITNTSTYDLNEVIKGSNPQSEPLPQPQHYNPALQLQQMKQQSDYVQQQQVNKQHFSSFPKDRTVPGMGHSDPGLVSLERTGFDMSVAELQMILDQKKRKLRESRDECSSLESGFCSQSSIGAGSLDDGDSLDLDSDRELRAGIGQRLERKVNMRHARTVQLEREEMQKRLKLLEEEIAQEDIINNEEIINHENNSCEENGENVKDGSINDQDEDEDDSEEDMYGADDDDLEQLAKIKEKFKSDKSSEKVQNPSKEVFNQPVVLSEVEHPEEVVEADQAENSHVEDVETKKSEVNSSEEQLEENDENNNAPDEEAQLGIHYDYDDRGNLDFSHDEDLDLVKDYKYVDEPRFSSDSESHEDYSSGAEEL